MEGDTAVQTLSRFLRRFLPLYRRNKATDGRRRALLAAIPSYTCCSSSPKISHRFARCDFRGPRCFLGHTYYLWAQIHPFPKSRRYAANWGRFLKNVVFKRALNYFSIRANSLFPRMPFGILRAKTKIAISVFASYYFNNQLRVPKSQFWISAPNLSHTCDLRG